MPNPNPKGPGPGRPKGSLNKISLEIRTIAQRHGKEAIEGLVSLAHGAESEAARVAAWKEILDRAYGKAVQAHDGDGQGGSIRHKVLVEFVRAPKAIGKTADDQLDGRDPKSRPLEEGL